MSHNSTFSSWVEAMRLRTLPVSLAGVTAAAGYAALYDTVDVTVIVLCALFAVLAQIASNFANEYYDYRDGLDRPGRVGPRRGVTEGDITPRAMKLATYGTLGAACCVGCALIPYGGWWLVGAGVLIGLGALSYSAGPYPLSRHALGEVAVFLFFGLVPVTLTFYLQARCVPPTVWAGAAALGFLGADILIVNNYRDVDDDRAASKTTLAVKWGRPLSRALYLFDGLVAVALMLPAWISIGLWSLTIPGLFLVQHIALWRQLGRREGAALNPLLGMTAMLMFVYSLAFALLAAV